MKGKLRIGVAALLAAVIVLSGMFVGWSAAYFTDTKTVDRTFTFGSVDIILQEPEFPPDPPPSVPNEKTPKNPIIYNNGTEDCVAFAVITVPVAEFVPVNPDGSKGEPGRYPVYSLGTSGSDGMDGNAFGDGWVLLDTSGTDESIIYTLGYRSVLPPSGTQVGNPDDYELLDSRTTAVFDYVILQDFLEGTLEGRYQILVDAYGIQPTGGDSILTDDELAGLWASYGSQAE